MLQGAAEGLRALASKAKEFLACVEQAQIEAAYLRGGDLVPEVSQARQRWRNFMSQEGDARLSRIVSRFASVSRALSKRGRELTQEERDKLMTAAHEVLVTLEEETGKILAAVDRRKD